MGLVVRTPTEYEWDVVQVIELRHKNKKWSSNHSNHIRFSYSDHKDKTCINIGNNVITYGNGIMGVYVIDGYKFISFNEYISEAVGNKCITKADALKFQLDYLSNKEEWYD